MKINKINWESINFDDKAVLCFIVKEKKILLIKKKKGLGTGKIVAPGGRIEPGETEAQAVIRELNEETGLTPENPEKTAELSFVFLQGYSLFCSVFIAHNCTGRIIETDEAIPFWFSQYEIPYERMWEDNPLWVPKILAGFYIKGYFTYDDREIMIKSRIIELNKF